MIMFSHMMKTLQSFDISRDQHIIDMIKRSDQNCTKKIFRFLHHHGHPRFWMKDNLKAIKGGKLFKKYYPLWAQYIIKFIQAYKNQGILIDALTIQK